ncbi:uncharacterized protein LOC132131668 [Carassius carassius]|uniref:uncharacterized protein LOC132131668 n=1 Tax=Carassius carassius TaxID=217509 RepID=UPI0028697281|nr:uncharacterized protein LOC132131668 [Carassius carassius]
MEGFIMLIMIVFVVEAVVGSNSVSVTEGDFVTLKSDVSMQERDKILWYFNDTLIALIREDPSEGCVYDGEGQIFRNRLLVDFETGSLTITNIRSEHAGRYEAEIIRNEISETSQSDSECDRTKIITKMINTGDTVKTFSVSIRPDSFSDHSVISASRSRPDKSNKGSYYKEKEQVCKKSSVLSVALVAGVCAVGVVLVAAAVLGVFYYRDMSSKKGKEKNKSEHLLTVSA